MKTVLWALFATSFFFSGCTSHKCVYFKVYDSNSELRVELPEGGYAPFNVDGGALVASGRVSYFSMPVADTEEQAINIKKHCVDALPEGVFTQN